jgi:hypothetical protein
MLSSRQRWLLALGLVLLALTVLVAAVPPLFGKRLYGDEYWVKFWLGWASSAAAASTIGLAIWTVTYGMGRR